MIEIKKKSPERGDGGKFLAGDKFGRITKLPEARLEELHVLLKRGVSPNYVAKMIQDEWKMHTDISMEGLGQLIRKYRDEQITDLELVEKIDPKTASNIIEKAKTHLNVLDKYAEMLDLQEKQVRLAAQRGEQATFPLAIMNDSMMVMGRLMKDYGDLALKVGIAQRMVGDVSEGRVRFEPRNLEEAFGNRIISGDMVAVINGLLEDLGADGAFD